METAPPMKSKPLHNFSLPLLKWAHKNHTHTTTTTHKRLPRPNSNSDSDSDNPNNYHHLPRPRTVRSNRFSLPLSSSQQQEEKQNAVVSERETHNEGEELTAISKPWNLRPRKVVVVDEVGTTFKSDKSAVLAIPATSEKVVVKSARLRGLVEGGGEEGMERREKRKFWISLKKEEIEEDLYALTGGKPARRPKKRPKNVQKLLDNVFPGLYLVGVTAESYRVHDATRT